MISASMKVSNNLFDLQGQVAIVTGATRGIGKAIASGLLSAGANVTGLARSVETTSATSSFRFRECDVTDRLGFGCLVKDVFNEFGRIDILVNAAGITIPLQASDDPSLVFSQTISCNLTAVYDSCLAVIPFMRTAKYGSIINITSIGAKLGFPNNPSYVASKGGVSALTRALALDYGLYGIRINSLVPGYVRTSMTEKSLF